MPDKTIKESYMDDWDPNWPKENNALKADEETITAALNDGLIASADSPSVYPATTMSKILTNSVYGSTIFTDKAMPSIPSLKPLVGSDLSEIETKVEHLLVDVTLLKSRVDELEQENELLRRRVDDANTENEDLRRRDEVLERHINELKLKFML